MVQGCGSACVRGIGEVYELATFLKDPKKADKIEVLPVKELLGAISAS